MKALHINGVQETPEEVAVREDRVKALILKHWQSMSDFEIGLLAEPSLGCNVIRELRLRMGLKRPKTKLWKRLMVRAAM